MKRVLPAILLLLALGAAPVKTFAQEHRAVVIFVQFPDLKFNSTAEEFSSLLDKLSSYFNYQFLGKKTFIFDAGPTVTLSNSYSYYGANSPDRRDALLHRMVSEACRQADGSVNFALYDNDNDGNTGDILIIVPGISEADGAGENGFWPQYANLEDQNMQLTLDRKRITTFGLATELGRDGKISGIGILAHEFGHILGLKDFYDTDDADSGGTCRGLWGTTSIMDMGNRNDGGMTPPNLNAIERDELGNGSCTILDSCGEYSLEAIDKDGHYYMIPGPDPLEYYLFECRRASGHDAFIGGSGMLIYHVDKRERPAGWSSYYKDNITAAFRWQKNQINCNPDFECAAMAPADPDASDAGGAFWPKEGHNSFCSETLPSFRFRSGGGCRFALTDIETGPDAVSFRLMEPIRISGKTIFQGSAILNWELSPEIGKVDSCRIEWYSVPEEPSGMKCLPAGPGSYCGIIEGLSPRTDYSYKITVYSGTNVRYSLEGSFTTLNYRAGIFRFIFLRNAERNQDGSFVRGSRIPLVVFNSVGDERTEWFFNGKAISAGSDGLWEIEESGTLMARVYGSDGDKDTIIKEISVK